MYLEVGISTEGEVEGPAVGDALNNIWWLDAWFGIGSGDEGCGKKMADDGGKAIPDTVVAGCFRDSGTVEYMLPFGINDGATNACREIGREEV